MFGKHHYLLLGIVALCLSYIMFTGQQYFSIPAMAGLFFLALIGALLFILPHIYAHRIENPKIFLSFLALIVVVGVYEYAFNLPAPGFLLQVGYELLLLAISTAISIYGIYALAKAIDKTKGVKYAAYALGGIIVIAFLAYAVMYIINSVQWQGVDEVAFNYYASYLLLHGQNPYTTSMQYITSAYNIQPTVQLSGNYEYAYDYPVMSFLPFIFLPLLGVTNLLSFTYLTILLSLVAAFLLYRKSEYSKHLLIPLAAWLVATYALVGVASQYLAVSIFLFLAYLYRSKPIESGVLLGLGASTIQLTWFAIPFFFVLMLREKGARALGQSIFSSVLTFALVNAYFVAISPGAIANILSIFGLSKLIVYGTNIMQFAVAFYALPYWYSAFISILSFGALLGLYYFYTKTLRPLLAIVPMMLFFLAWRNITIYGLPFIPILLAIYFWQDHHKYEDILKRKMEILYVLLGVVLIGAIVAVIAHQSYIGSSSLKVQSVYPVISVQNGYYGTQLGLLGLDARVNNTFGSDQTVSFLVISRGPNNEQYFLGSMLNQSMPDSLSNYTLQYELPAINNNTQIAILLFNQNYISSKIINFSGLRQNFR